MVDASLFKLMVEQSKDYALFLLDPSGHIRSWNVGAERIKGYTAEEIIGRHFSVFYPREALDSGWPQHELQVATLEGRFEDEGWRLRKDGSRFWASVVITAMRDEHGKLVGFSKITRDLTDRMLHEEALRQSEERFRLLIEGVVDYAIFMLDPEGMVTSWNAGAERIKGYSRDEIVGKHFSRFYTAEDVQAGKPWEALATARRSGHSEAEGWRMRKDGGRFWARAVVSALHDAQGHLRGFAKVTQDLTERRHMQDLERAAKNLNEFIAVLAHELRNPIAPIRSALEVMAKLPPGAPASDAMRQTIDRQSAQLARIVDDLVDVARVSRGSLTIERRALGLEEIVHRAVEAAGPAIETAKHTLEVELPAERLVVNGDVYRLTQLFTNLLNNAARFTPSGGKIWIRARAEAGCALLSVRDTGRGIEPGMIRHIFDMFVQGRTPLERVAGGLGIGLAVARRIAELHGGTLEAHSEGADKGAEFTVRIPVLEASASVPAPAPPEAPKPMASRRVLIADDNVDAAITLDMLLKSLGHETCVVHDGLAAVRMASEFRPDVVLLDIGMPGLDGYEVARRLRALKSDTPFRIVAVTGWGQDADRVKSREAGFDLHLVKPLDLQDLAHALGGRNGATLH